MKEIHSPIAFDDRGAAIANLHEVLLHLLNVSPLGPRPDNYKPGIDQLVIEQQDNTYGLATVEALSWFQRSRQEAFALPDVSGKLVDEPTAAALNVVLAQLGAFGPPQAIAFKIVGHVEFADGTPAIGYGVTAFDRDLGNSRLALGDSEHPAITDENGDFPAILYRAEEFVRGEGKSGPNADLVFEVAGPNEPEPHSIVSIFRRFSIGRNVQDVAVADLVLGFEANASEDVRIVLSGRPATAGQSEYGRLMDALGPLLENGRTPAEFDQQEYRDIDFAARETAWARALIETMVEAWRLARAASRNVSLKRFTVFFGRTHLPPFRPSPAH
jgi:hypothetical protein